MRPSDYNISGAEAKLEAKLQDHNRRPWVFQMRSRTFQAEYNRTFWSHIDVAIKKAKFKDCRGARRDLGLMRHVCWAFMLVGDDGLGHGEQGGTPRRQ